MIVYQVVLDFGRYALFGRNLDRTSGEIGLAVLWVKIMLHHMFRGPTAPWLIPHP